MNFDSVTLVVCHYAVKERRPHDVGVTAEGDAFAEENSHIRQEAVEGDVEAYCTCYIGFCTLRCTKMDLKKRRGDPDNPSI
jgi:hypothetical protein